jgi:hypothetical protein
MSIADRFSLDRFVQKLREKGLGGLPVWAFRTYIYRRSVAVFLERELDIPPPLKLRSGVEIERLTEIDERRFVEHFPRHIEVYRRLLDEGCVAYAAVLDDVVIGIGWWADHDFFDAEVYRHTFAVQPHQIYQFAGEVAPKYRHTSAALAAIRESWRLFSDQGRSRVYAISDLENVTSLKFHRHVGFEPSGKALVTYRLFTRAWSVERPLRPSELEVWHNSTARRQRAPAGQVAQ